jgi:hypothetical protein
MVTIVAVLTTTLALTTTAGPGGPDCTEVPTTMPGYTIRYCCPAGSDWHFGQLTGCETAANKAAREQAEVERRQTEWDLEIVRLEVLAQLAAAVEDQHQLAREAQARAQRDEVMRTALINTPPPPKPVKRKTDWSRSVLLEPKPAPFDDPWDRGQQRTVVIDDSVVLRIGGPGGIEMKATTLLEMLQKMASDIEQLKALVAAKADRTKRAR